MALARKREQPCGVWLLKMLTSGTACVSRHGMPRAGSQP